MSDDIDPWAYVWSLNGERRDLTADQRYLIWTSCHEHSESWLAEAARISAEANAKRAEAARTQHEVSKPWAGEAKPRDGAATTSGTTISPPAPNRTTAAKATASKTNRGAVERMDHLKASRPDLADQVKAGAIPAAAAIREMKRAAVVATLEDTAVREVKASEGVYDVLVIDPPWEMQKIDRDERPNQVGFDYPTMDEARPFTVPTAIDSRHTANKILRDAGLPKAF